MNEAQQQNKSYMRLRDFGDFRFDIAACVTEKMASIEVGNTLEVANPLSISQAMLLKEGPSAQDAATTIIQIPAPATPVFWRSAPGVTSQGLLQKVKSNKWVSLAVRAGITLFLFVFLFRSLSWSALLGALT